MIYICPPLLFQILFRSYSDASSFPLRCNLTSYHVACLVAYLLFKAKVITIRMYEYLFDIISVSYLRNKKSPSTVVSYQDYLGKFSTLPCHHKYIKEFIILPSQNTDNFQSSITCVRQASSVVCPTLEIASILRLNDYRGPLVYAPYGGDIDKFINQKSEPKLGTIKTLLLNSRHMKSYNRNECFVVVARANTTRKGGDIFLEAIKEIIVKGVDLVLSSQYKFLSIIIAGTIEASLQADLNYIRSLSKFMPQLSISARQYSRLEYLTLLRHCNLFVMPSYLEGSSLAALEALNNGIPSILTQHCGVEQFKDPEYGIMLESITKDSLLEALYFMISSQTYLNECRKLLNRDKDLFSWKRYIESYSKALESTYLNEI